MVKLLRANFVRMFRSLEFMACALFSFALGLLNMLFCLVLAAPSYRSTFENDLFNMSKAVIIISAVFVGLFFGTENSVVRNKLTVGHTRAAVFWANCITAFTGVFIINALSMLPYAVAASLCGTKLGGLTPDELMFNVLIEILAELAAGGVCFLITVIASRKSICAANSLLSAIILMCLPEIDKSMQYSPVGQLDMLKNKLYTTRSAALLSLGIIAVTVAVGAAVFSRKNLK